MPAFSAKSKERLATCDDRLQRLFNAVVERVDITILCGHRGEQDQNMAFANKTSLLKFPKSKHNSLPSHAVDVAPYPLDWNNVHRFREVAKIIKETASELGIPVKWGGDWQTIVDLPHWEI